MMKLFKDLKEGDDLYVVAIQLHLENVTDITQRLVDVLTTTLTITNVKTFFKDDDARTINVGVTNEDVYVPTYFGAKESNDFVYSTGIKGTIVFSDKDEYEKFLNRVNDVFKC